MGGPVPIADGAFKHPIRHRPEMRAAVIVMERKVKGQMHERGPRKHHRVLGPKPPGQPERPAPDKKGIVDGKDLLPGGREVELIEYRLRGDLQDVERHGRH